MVEAVLPRRSALARPDVFYAHLQQLIVANVDQVLIVAAWREPAFWPELVDRYLIAAARDNLAPIICINEIDLAGDADDDPAELTRPWPSTDRPAIASSPPACGPAMGWPSCERHCGRTTALAGLSGVGKSSLLSAAEPGLHLRTAEVSDRRMRADTRRRRSRCTRWPRAASWSTPPASASSAWQG